MLLLCTGIVMGQQTRELNLRGDRFKPLTWETLTPDQKTMVNDLLAGKRTSLGGPFNALLRSPEMGNHAQKLGEYVRFRTSLPAAPQRDGHPADGEVVVVAIRVARAQAAGADRGAERGRRSTICKPGSGPTGMKPDEAVIYDFSAELRERRRVSDATYSAAVKLLGERGVVDLVAAMGYYDLVSMVLNVDRYPLPDGAPLPFPEPK